MFNNLITYYLSNAQTRINKRIKEINAQRAELKSSGDIRYKGLKAIKNTHLYSSKPKTVKDIREAEPETLAEKLSVTVAESLIANIKLKPEFKTASSDKDVEIQLKKDNLEFLSLQELFWGFDDSPELYDKFNFFLHLFLDLENHDEYSSVVHNALVDYVPYAKYVALEKATKEGVEFSNMVAPDYKNSNVDVFAEAVFSFCMTNDTSDEVMERFTDFVKKPYEYESKDKNGRFLMKEVVVNFQIFGKAFEKVLKNVLEPIFKMDTQNSLGKRAYDLVVDDFKIKTDLMEYSMVRGPESHGRYLTMSEKSDVDVMTDLLEASATYVGILTQVQQDFYGNIEQEYFASDMFSAPSTYYFSESRFHELVKEMMEQQQLEELSNLLSANVVEDSTETMTIEHLTEQSVVNFTYEVVEGIQLAAGSGYGFFDEFETRTVFASQEQPPHDVAVWIKGDSMLPTYQSGEVALINASGFDYDGAVYAVVINGETVIKKVHRELDGIRLVSINEDYPDRFVSAEEDINIVGKVVGHFMPI